MDLAILSSALSGIKHLPEAISGLIILVAVILSFVFKTKSQDHQQITEVSKLQSDQLKVLIEQNEKLINKNEKLININSELSQQLQSLRAELSEAYTVIDNLRYEFHVLQRQYSKGDK